MAVGMLVCCCKSYEEVHVGDIGKVVKIDREGLHDLNLQVRHVKKNCKFINSASFR